MTPERVAEQIQDVRVYQTAQDGLNAADPELVKDEKVWRQAAEILRANPDFTAADITDMYRKALAEKRSTTVSKKVAKTPARRRQQPVRANPASRTAKTSHSSMNAISTGSTEAHPQNTSTALAPSG